MQKIKEDILKNLKVYIIALIISLLIGLGLFLTFFLLNKGIAGAIDGTGIPGAILLGVGLLCWIGRLGTFDSMSYGFSQMFTSMFGRKANKYHDFNAYVDDKRVKRKSASHYYFVIMIVGALFLIALGVLMIYKNAVYNV